MVWQSLYIEGDPDTIEKLYHEHIKDLLGKGKGKIHLISLEPMKTEVSDEEDD